MRWSCWCLQIFFVNVGKLLDVTTKIFEKNYLNILETFKSMPSITDQYLGSAAKQLLKILPQTKKNKTVKAVCDFYLNSLTY